MQRIVVVKALPSIQCVLHENSPAPHGLRASSRFRIHRTARHMFAAGVGDITSAFIQSM
jgi:hypothetical protein